MPKPAAWDLGVFLAERMLRDHVAEHGRYPEKVSFVIWGAETLRHEGILESQIFHLLGTRPVWDVRGNVVDIEVVPARELGRPRVDIVIASAAEGMFNNVTRLMDEAVQRVKVLEEAENYVRRHYLATRAALVDRGYSEEDAERRAGVRIFDEPPGTFNLNTSRIAAASGTWDSDAPMADEYLSKMGHGYGNGFWGEPMEDVFRLALSGTEKVVHSSSTMLYGALDNDDFFMYMGGLAAAVRSIDGETPEMVVTNTRDPGQPQMTGIDKFIGAEFRTRYVNPTWIEGMQGEGYAGAGEMRAFVEYLWGWDAVAPETVDDAMWQESFAVYVEDRHDLDLEAFFDEHSPHVYQDITGRMVETIRKGYWETDAATLERLLREHVDSVAEHGVGCSVQTCANPRLLRYVLEQGAVMNIPGPRPRRLPGGDGGGPRRRHRVGRGRGRGVRPLERVAARGDDDEHRGAADGGVRGRRRAAARAAGLGRRGGLDPALGRRPPRGAARGVAVAPPPRTGVHAVARCGRLERRRAALSGDDWPGHPWRRPCRIRPADGPCLVAPPRRLPSSCSPPPRPVRNRRQSRSRCADRRAAPADLQSHGIAHSRHPRRRLALRAGMERGRGRGARRPPGRRSFGGRVRPRSLIAYGGGSISPLATQHAHAPVCAAAPPSAVGNRYHRDRRGERDSMHSR